MSMKTKLGAFWRSSRVGRFFRRYGAVSALVGCAVIVGVVYAITWSNESPQQPTPTVSEEPAPYSHHFPMLDDTSQRLYDILVTPVPYKAVAPQPTRVPQVTPAAEPGISKPDPAVPQMLRPAEGNIVAAFSQDALVFSQTLQQWSTHPGVDISGTEGAPVCAVLDGVVTEVVRDELMGICVRVSHDNDMESFYAGLSQANVDTGRKLKQGDMLGTMGDTAIAEAAQGDHLHFEFTVKGKTINPVPFFIGK